MKTRGTDTVSKNVHGHKNEPYCIAVLFVFMSHSFQENGIANTIFFFNLTLQALSTMIVVSIRLIS